MWTVYIILKKAQVDGLSKAMQPSLLTNATFSPAYCISHLDACNHRCWQMPHFPKKPVSVPFKNNYVYSWGADHIKEFHGGRKVELLLNKQYGKLLSIPFLSAYFWAVLCLSGYNTVVWNMGLTGARFELKGTYLFGHFSMEIKLVPGDSAGTVTAFYVSRFIIIVTGFFWSCCSLTLITLSVCVLWGSSFLPRLQSTTR